MSYLPSLMTLAGVTLVGAMSPSPDFATTVYYSTRSRREGIFVTLGITSALALWIMGPLALTEGGSMPLLNVSIEEPIPGTGVKALHFGRQRYRRTE